MQLLPRLLTYVVGIAAATLISVTSQAARLDDAVILASTVPGYVPGMVVAADDPLRLPAGASATLLLQSGEMLRLRGPYDGALSRAEPRPGASAARLADAFRLLGVDATVIGGTRALTNSIGRTDLEEVVIDPRRSGTWCVAPRPSVWLERPGAGPASFALRRKRTVRPVTWPSGTQRIEWPADLPIEDDDRYDVMVDGGAVATLTFRVITTTPSATAARVAQGVVMGCHDQFDPALRNLGRTALTPDVWITSDQGRNPVLKAGQKLTVTVMSGSDGYLSCVSVLPDGKALPVFPAGGPGSGSQGGGADARTETLSSTTVPGQRQDFALAAPKGGSALVRCWLSDADSPAELAQIAAAKDLGAVLASKGAGRVALDEFTIQVSD